MPSSEDATDPAAGNDAPPRWIALLHDRRALRVITIVFCGLFLHLLYRAGREVSRPQGADLTAYTDAAWLMREGRSPYRMEAQLEELRAAGQLPQSMAEHGAFDLPYPPILPWLLQPIATFPLWLLGGLWFLGQCALILWISRLVTRAVRRTHQSRSTTPGLVLALLVAIPLYRPLHSTLVGGQVNLLLFALIMRYLLDAERGRSIRAGFSLALAMMLKVTPGILLLHALIRRDVRTLISVTLWSALIAVLPATTLGLDATVDVWRQFFEIAQDPEQIKPFYESRGRSIYMGFWGFLASIEPDLTYSKVGQYVGLVLTATLAAGCHLFLMRRARLQGDPTGRLLLAGTIYLACTPLFSPRPQKQHLSALLPAMVAGVAFTFGCLRAIPRPGLVLWSTATLGLWLGKALPSSPVYLLAILSTVAFATWASRGPRTVSSS